MLCSKAINCVNYILILFLNIEFSLEYYVYLLVNFSVFSNALLRKYTEYRTKYSRMDLVNDIPSNF